MPTRGCASGSTWSCSTAGRACRPQVIPDLVDTRGRLPDDPFVVGLRWFLQPAVQEQIRREVRAQVERFLASGLTPDHLNSHHHFYVHPVVFQTLLDMAEELGVRHIRLPRQPWWFSLRLDWRDAPRKLAYAVLFELLARYYRPRLMARGLAVTDGTFGLLQTGNISEEYLSALLCRLPEGMYELYTHPRLDTAAGLREVRALISPRVRGLIQKRTINLTTYSAVSASGEPSDS